MAQHMPPVPDKTQDKSQPIAQPPAGSGALAKFLIELGPLLVFFIAFNRLGIYWATGLFMAAMLVAISVSYLRERHISPMLWVTLVVVMVMGSLTLYFQNETFVKMKPTLINGLFGALLLGGLMVGRPLVKTVMSAGLPHMSDRGWMLLSRNWGIYFCAMAVINEVVWRSTSTDMWVTIKTFGYLPLTFVFTITQVPLILKYGGVSMDEKAQ